MVKFLSQCAIQIEVMNAATEGAEFPIARFSSTQADESQSSKKMKPLTRVGRT
jgi:hypothetical protein